jgi:hypothetical protein
MSFDMSLNTRILVKALERGKEKAKAYCKSRTLKKAMYAPITHEGKTISKGMIRVPHYWAKYFHDGRNAVQKFPKGPMLIYYKDPSQDPRIQPNYPVYKSDVRKLTKEQFLRDREAGKLIVVPAVGPTAQPQNPFFSNTGGMAGFDTEVGQIARAETSAYVNEWLNRTGLKNKKIVCTL